MIRKTFRYLLVCIVFFYNCKSSKTISGGEANYKLSTKQLIKENTKQKANFKTFQSKLKIAYNNNGNEQTHSVNFRAKKDEVLWINSAFSVIRAMVTPEKVSFYNKLDNTYFEGDFTYLSALLGTELDFQKVQNLLYGEILYSVKDDSYISSVDNNKYILEPKMQRELFEIFFLLDPTHFKIKSQQITQPKERRHLQIDYVSYQEVDKQIFPELLEIIAVENTNEINIDLEFKGVALNEDLRFPFKIPSGFKKIEL